MFENSYMNLYKKKKKQFLTSSKACCLANRLTEKNSRFKNALALEFIREITLDRNVI